MDTTNRVADISTSYLKQKEEVIMAFLFGSYASGRVCHESDVDIALYLEREDYNLEIDIQNALEKLLGKEVDLVILSRAPATLSWQIIRRGIPLTIKDRGIYLDFLLDVSGEAQDFLDFNLDAWRRKYGIRAGR